MSNFTIQDLQIEDSVNQTILDLEVQTSPTPIITEITCYGDFLTNTPLNSIYTFSFK